jgi:predicted nucleotidyltransferase
MYISKEEFIAGYPALTVRGFLRRYRSFGITAAAAAQELDLGALQAQEFLRGLEAAGFIEPAADPLPDSETAYETTIQGNALANASAAKPIRRATAELALRQFMTRLDRLNASEEYVYRVTSAVLFGSMLSDAERLGDVDIAIELESRVDDEAEFRKRCDGRRKLAAQRGTHFGNTFDWVYWPRMEIFRALRARARSLSLHGWDEVTQIPGLRYRVLLGNRERITAMIPSGECVMAEETAREGSEEGTRVTTTR